MREIQQDELNTEEALLPGMVELRDPRELHLHPLNALIYGTAIDPGLRIDIAANGVQEALVITTGNSIVSSGHCCCAVASELGLPHVPVNVSPLTDPLEIQAAMINSNRRRPKRNYQAAREYQQLKPMQAELARRCHRLGQANDDLGANWLSGRARDIAAEMVSLKLMTADATMLLSQQQERDI